MLRTVQLLSVALFLTTGCPNTNPGGADPVLVITAPTAGQHFNDNENVEVSLVATDLETPSTQLLVRISTDREEGVLLEGEQPDDDEGNMLRSVGMLSVGAHKLTFTVTDADQQTATGTRDIVIDTTDAPVAEITAPLQDDAFLEGDAIDFVGAVSDENDALDSLAVTWTTDGPTQSGDPELYSGLASASGDTSFVDSELLEGAHTITLTVRNSAGLEGLDTVGVDVLGLGSFDGDGDCFCADDPCLDSVDPGCSTLEEGDCDDNDSAIHPDASETSCDGVDNDCDPATLDEFDSDTDGVGSCSDCDDNEAEVFPGNPEICDGLDNDCANGVDDGLSTDADGDGFYATGSCQTPGGDCQDGDPAINPGVAEDQCDGVDNNCDGQVDPSPADSDADGANECLDCNDSDPALNLIDVDADTFSSCAGDCNDSSNAVNPAATEISYDDEIGRASCRERV